jgi:isoleucyl-tRNA synthetase
MEEKAPFKTLLGHALVKDETGRDMHKSWGNTIWFDEAAEEMGVDVMRWMYARQNPEHNLLFGYHLADEVRKQLITLWNTYSFFVTYANLDGFSPSDPIKINDLSKSDHWIRSKTNVFIQSSIAYYESYQLFRLMKEAEELLDNLSNWYVRRNRRRFWKSENDGDKNAAYHTLYSVLMDFIKVMAPVIPFVCDKIYANLSVPDPAHKNDSIHLCEFPQADDTLTHTDILNEVDIVIHIVSLGRSARNKANIKIRQPLAELAVFGNEESLMIARDNQVEILEELNIKSLKLVANEAELVNFVVKPNFKLLSQKYGEDMGRITQFIQETDPNTIMEKINASKTIEVNWQGGSLEILPEELILEEVAEQGYSVTSSRHVIVGVYTEISDELKQEGMVRDLIRQVQNLRKDSGLRVEDRIEIGIQGPRDLQNALRSHESYFMNEVLGVKLQLKEAESLAYNQSVKINGNHITIGISPIN